MPDLGTAALCVLVVVPAVYVSWKNDEWRRRIAAYGERRGIGWGTRLRQRRLARRQRPTSPTQPNTEDQP